MASSGHRAKLPRFLPPDPRVEEPYLLTPRTALRVAILGVVALVVFAVLLLRLWSLQILSGSQYLNDALNNQIRTLSIEAARGPILDAKGRVLVTNVPGAKVDLTPVDLPKGDGRATELHQLSMVLRIPVAEIQAKIRQLGSDPLTPITLKRAVHNDQVNYLKEHKAQFPGVKVESTYLRHYTRQAFAAAQVLGYDGEVSPDQLKRLGKDYSPGDIVGQQGVEASYDNYLRGKAGQEQVTVNAVGLPTVNSVSAKNVLPTPGSTVRLTIDSQLQRAAERGLQYGIDLAHADGKWAADGGAIVALDPRNGAVLAMASSPTYKPSVFVGRTDPKKLAPLIGTDAVKANYPLLNRAIQGVYPAGSTFKPVTALAALQEHVISPFESLQCAPTFTVHGFTGAGQTFKNWTPLYDEPMTLPMALATSCDTYFYRVGYDFYGLSSDRGHPLQNWASRFGFGLPTGIDLGPESQGLLPTPEWRQQAYTKATDPCCWQIDRLWKPGDSIQLAIGQKDLGVTPLQLARFYAVIANGGKLVTPHVVADVEQPGANGKPSVVLRVSPTPQSTGVDPAALSVVRDGLYQATHESFGTSSGVFGQYPVAIAGKTGTAEKVVNLPGFHGLMDQSEWCGFGPYDNPTIVVCALIENGGHGGTAAAPAALRVFEQYFGVKAGATGTVPSD